MSATSLTSTARPLVVDTDPGVDDAFALALALASPEVDVVAVTSVFGNVDLDTTTRNARGLLGLAGRPDVPLGRGADRPLIHPTPGRAADVHGDDGLGGRADAFVPLGPEPTHRAVDLLAATLEAAAEPVTLAAIAPLTNVALLLATRPDLAGRIGRLVVMGGSIGYGGNMTAAAEFNLWCDPEAAHRVLAGSAIPTTLVPLDLTMRTLVDEPWLDAVAGSGPVGAALAATRDTYLATYSGRFDRPAIPLHDAVAVLEAIVPGTLSTTPMPLEVDVSLGPGRGGVIADRRGDRAGSSEGSGSAGSASRDRRLVDVALTADVEHVRTEIARRLAG